MHGQEKTISFLAETVLRHIRSGSTQIKAFDEVGDALNRTSAACGFRWNAEVRANYEDAVQIAKKQRKELKRSEAKIEKEQFTQTRQLVIDAEFSEKYHAKSTGTYNAKCHLIFAKHGT